MFLNIPNIIAYTYQTTTSKKYRTLVHLESIVPDEEFRNPSSYDGLGSGLSPSNIGGTGDGAGAGGGGGGFDTNTETPGVGGAGHDGSLSFVFI